MTTPLTSEVVVAHSQCPRKAYLLLRGGAPGEPHEYVRIQERRASANRERFLSTIVETSEVATRRVLRQGNFEVYCDVLTRRGGEEYEPTLIVGTGPITKEQRIALAYVGHVVGQLHGRRPASGRIVLKDGNAQRVKLEASYAALGTMLTALRAWSEQLPPEAPEVNLNDHCPVCPFRQECLAIAEKADSLTLLARMTPKLVRRFHKKGIFTITQLSYLYRPRRRKRSRPSDTSFKVELQALAIRTGKIYLHELPRVPRAAVELFLDVEGIPEEQSYYLIGVSVLRAGALEHHTFWANTPSDEANIWQSFLGMVSEYPGAPIFHYGAYERKAIATLGKRHGPNDGRLESLTQRLVNLSAHVHGKVYFPVRSNSLKDIGSFLGARWTSPVASGLQSLVWRDQWEISGDHQVRESLQAYNREDCHAAKILADALSQIDAFADDMGQVDYADRPKRCCSEAGELAHRQLEAVLKFASAAYHSRRRISFQPHPAPARKKRARRLRKRRRRITHTVLVPQRSTCPKCPNSSLRPSSSMSRRVLLDFILTRGGMRKRVIRYCGPQGYCPQCGRYYHPPDLAKYHKSEMYGRGFKAWVVYQRVALRLSYESIAESAYEQFGEPVSENSIPNFIREFARYYPDCERTMKERLLQSPFIHADETAISIRGVEYYVWVFTDGRHVVFQLHKTREGTVAQEFLAGYGGVVVSDFYAGYDAVPCRQQKCWPHLIRDLNDDLWAAPFDAEFERFVLAVRNLIIPIMQALHGGGAKARGLDRFLDSVEEFYAGTIFGTTYSSELASKYQKRFVKHKESLFTFLKCEGIPWHNNTAETAIRHLVVQEKISGSFFESVTHHYLVLLSIGQACRFQAKSFFKFLFSGEKDVDLFMSPL
jgi:predicted RecB family nuclease